MSIDEALKSTRPTLSIEIFPPKTPKGVEGLKDRLKKFKEFNPDFVSITYGAGGNTQSGTLEFGSFVQNELGLTSMSHLTCATQTKEELDAYLDSLKQNNIENIMALRGDPPKGSDQFIAPKGGFGYASDLIDHIPRRGGFTLGCAGYPESHIESQSLDRDIDFLKLKIDKGASFVVTQFFLDNVYFYRFRDKCAKQDIKVPILAGVLPISNTNQISRFAFMCGCTIPARVMKGLHDKSDEDQEAFGLEHAAYQVEDLLKEGVDGIHLYCLNKKSAVDRLAPLVVAKR